MKEKYSYSKRMMRKAVLFCIQNENSSVSVNLCDTVYPLTDAIRIINKQNKLPVSFTLHYDGKDGEISFNNGSHIHFYEKFNEEECRKEN